MTTVPIHSKKELLWLKCREKACCYSRVVPITGQELCRISQTLQIPPVDFTTAVEVTGPDPDCFQLACSGPFYRVVLSKRYQKAMNLAVLAPCIFLWKVADGHAQCGLGNGRPLVCISYPARLVDGVLCVEQDSCTCQRWSLLDLDEGVERERAMLQHAATAEYRVLLAAWNGALVPGAPTCTYQEFCGYVMAYYTRNDESTQ